MSKKLNTEKLKKEAIDIIKKSDYQNGFILFTDDLIIGVGQSLKGLLAIKDHLEDSIQEYKNNLKK